MSLFCDYKTGIYRTPVPIIQNLSKVIWQIRTLVLLSNSEIKVDERNPSKYWCSDVTPIFEVTFMHIIKLPSLPNFQKLRFCGLHIMSKILVTQEQNEEFLNRNQKTIKIKSL